MYTPIGGGRVLVGGCHQKMGVYTPHRGGGLKNFLAVTAGIVSKRLNLSENFFDHLVASSFKHLGPLTPISNSKGNPFIGGVKYRGWENWRFSTYIAVYLGNGAR